MNRNDRGLGTGDKAYRAEFLIWSIRWLEREKEPTEYVLVGRDSLTGSFVYRPEFYTIKIKYIRKCIAKI